jgi:hypothetical protein
MQLGFVAYSRLQYPQNPTMQIESVAAFSGTLDIAGATRESIFLFSGHEPIYFIENKEKTLRASYDRGTQIVDYMD